MVGSLLENSLDIFLLAFYKHFVYNVYAIQGKVDETSKSVNGPLSLEG